jgi:hypothetical protein
MVDIVSFIIGLMLGYLCSYCFTKFFEEKKILMWRLGHLDKDNPTKSLIPSAAAIEKLINILKQDKSGRIHIVWGPDLDVTVVNSNDKPMKETDV